jgi:predicted DNA-binding transcriptional regulator AlpA
VLAMTKLSRTTLWRLQSKGRFPAGHLISPNQRRWFSSELRAWQDSLPQNGRIGRKIRNQMK